MNDDQWSLLLIRHPYLVFIPLFSCITVNHQPYIAFHFFLKCFCCYFCPFLSTKLFLHIYHVVTGGEIYNRPDNLASYLLLYVTEAILQNYNVMTGSEI